MTPTRSAALSRLEAFLPSAGAKYASFRNFDHGPDQNQNVSLLSPYIRTRLITEEEVTRRVLSQHSAKSAEKFLQEIAWRSYWKGWLEMRPQVWPDYQSELHALDRSKAYQQATQARTGIDCFDTWTQELIDHGYLHNHTRMWFASIWIFTLKLPWQLGPDFFMHHLLDADAASNTLSWRWVAGLHTAGKHYVARAENIRKYTNGRFHPVGQLNESAQPLPLDRSYQIQDLRFTDAGIPNGRTGLLLSHEDLSIPSNLSASSIALVSPDAIHRRGQPAQQFFHGAIGDVQNRNSAILLESDLEQAINDWVQRESLDSIVLNRVTVGPWRDTLEAIQFPVPKHEITCSWDRQLWPKAGSGFFKLKKSLPAIHASYSRSQQLDLL